MATQRYISTSFWDDDWIQTLDPSEKLLYLYFMTCPLTNIAGVYKITPRRVSFDTGFTLDTINHIMQKFEKAGKAYRKDEYVILPNWPKHQHWQEREGIKKGIDAVLKSLPDDILAFLIEVGYQYKGVEGGLKGGSTHQEPHYLESDIDNEFECEDKNKTKKHTFKIPELEEVKTYCRERDNGIDAQRFLDYYETRGWMLGKVKMKDWKAAVRTWEKNDTRKVEKPKEVINGLEDANFNG